MLFQSPVPLRAVRLSPIFQAVAAVDWAQLPSLIQLLCQSSVELIPTNHFACKCEARVSCPFGRMVFDNDNPGRTYVSA